MQTVQNIVVIHGCFSDKWKTTAVVSEGADWEEHISLVFCFSVHASRTQDCTASDVVSVSVQKKRGSAHSKSPSNPTRNTIKKKPERNTSEV